jgi:hypothetical protein
MRVVEVGAGGSRGLRVDWPAGDGEGDEHGRGLPALLAMGARHDAAHVATAPGPGPMPNGQLTGMGGVEKWRSNGGAMPASGRPALGSPTGLRVQRERLPLLQAEHDGRNGATGQRTHPVDPHVGEAALSQQ